jgi:DNA repair exonuclease SbcCD ATPase subunit
MKNPTVFLPIAVVLVLAGCNKATEPTADDIRVARGAIPTNEVLLMIRAGYKEPNVLKEIQTRHIPEKIDGETETKFASSGASAKVIAALKNKNNALTEIQKIVFDRQQGEKRMHVEQSAQSRQTEAFARQQEEQRELNRRRQLQQQTMQNINRNQSAQVSYEVAQKNYEAQRRYLEQRIASLEAEINRLRRYNYNEAELATANRNLDDYRKQLRDLTPPLR